MKPVFLYIGGQYGDRIWQSEESPDSQWHCWACSELQVFKIEGGKIYEPTNAGMWAEVRKGGGK